MHSLALLHHLMQDCKSLKMVKPQLLQFICVSDEKISTSPPHSGHFFTFKVGVPVIFAAPGQNFFAIENTSIYF